MPRLLVEIRGDRRQVDFARLVGVTQSKLSRLEKGVGPPLDADAAAAYAAAAGASPGQAARLIELAEVNTAIHQVPRAVMLRNAHVVQGRVRDYVRASSYVWSWTSDAVPAVLQTREWTTVMLESDGDGDPGPDWWAARNEHVALLDDRSRPWRLLLAEGALRWIVGSRRVQADLIEHIADVSLLEHVEIGVVDLATPKPFIASYGFHLYGDQAAEVASDLGAAFTTHGDDLSYLRGRFEQLWAHGQRGDDARTLLARIGRAIRH